MIKAKPKDRQPALIHRSEPRKVPLQTLLESFEEIGNRMTDDEQDAILRDFKAKEYCSGSPLPVE